MQVDWDPGADAPDGKNQVNIEGSPCNPWDITHPKNTGKACDIKFGPQITAPIPLEAVYEYYEFCVTSTFAQDRKELLPQTSFGRTGRGAQKKYWVTEEFFQANPDGFRTSDREVLGFFNLIVNHLKGEVEEGSSPKE